MIPLTPRAYMKMTRSNKMLTSSLATTQCQVEEAASRDASMIDIMNGDLRDVSIVNFYFSSLPGRLSIPVPISVAVETPNSVPKPPLWLSLPCCPGNYLRGMLSRPLGLHPSWRAFHITSSTLLSSLAPFQRPFENTPVMMIPNNSTLWGKLYIYIFCSVCLPLSRWRRLSMLLTSITLQFSIWPDGVPGPGFVLILATWANMLYSSSFHGARMPMLCGISRS